MKRSLLWFAIILAFLILPQAMAQNADVVLYNGKILTVDKDFSTAEAVAIKDGKFLAVGKNDEILRLAGPNTQKLDLKGKTVTPGQVHTHTHVHTAAEANYGGEVGIAKMKLYPINFRIVKTKDDVVQQIKNTMDAFKFPPNEWIYFSVTDLSVEATRLLWEGINRYDLDKATPNNPIVISLGVPSNSGYLTNSKGLEVLWAKYGDFIEKYGRYWLGPDGKPDGHLEPPAGRLAYPLAGGPKPEDVAEIYKKALEEHLSEGVTTLSTRLPDYAIEVYKHLDRKGELPVRFGYGIQDAFDTPDSSRLKKLKIGEGSDMLWVTSVSAGMVDGAGFGFCTDLKRNDKSVSDPNAFGVLGMDASNPMAEWYPRGWCHLDVEFRGGPKGKGAPIKGNYFSDWYGMVAENGLRSANTHVSGDASHRMMLTMYEKIDAVKPGAVKGWGMDHCSMINPRDIPRAARLGIQFSCGPGWGGDAFAKVFGEEAANNYPSPVKSLLNAGINVGLEGEFSYRWASIESLITRKDRNGKVWGAHERLDRATALRVSTQGGANYVIRGDKIGSIEKGKLADLVILNKDYMTVPEEQISDLYSLVTMVGGKFKYVHPEFANEYNFRPSGSLIMTHEETKKRQKKFETGALGARS